MASMGEKADCIIVPDVDFFMLILEQMLEGKLLASKRSIFRRTQIGSFTCGRFKHFFGAAVFVTQCGFQTPIF